MKATLTKVISLILSLTLCMTMLNMPGIASSSQENPITPRDAPMVVGELANPGDKVTYDLQVDHALYPKAVLYGFISEGTGNITIQVFNEDGSRKSGMWLRTKLYDNSTEYILAPRGACYVRSSEAVIKNYTIEVETDTGDVCFALNIGTIDDYAKYYGGFDNVAKMPKNVPSKANLTTSVYYNGAQMVLNEGEGFRYTADGYTYVTVWVENHDNLAFDIYDASTLELVYQSTASDCGIEQRNGTTQYYGYVQKGLELENGKEYLIKVYSRVHISTTSTNDRYFFSVGLPYISRHKMEYYPTKAYYVPANSMRTFYINVTDTTIPNSARASVGTGVYFSTGKGTESIYITSCKITAPNGQTFTLNNGYYTKFEQTSPINYFENINHVPIKGTWKVTVKTSKSLNLYFKIIGYCDYIMGYEGN